MNISSISPEDRRMYWENTWVINKKTGKPYVVISCTGRRFVLQPISGDPLEVTPGQFIDKYYCHRLRLGWRNSDNACMYASHTPGRSNRKGLQSRDIQLHSPLYRHINQAYMLGREQLITAERDQDVMYAALDKMTVLMNSVRSIEPHHNKYFNIFVNPFLPKREAVEAVLHGDRLGAAISPTWAVLSTPEAHDNRASLYRNSKQVGYINDSTLAFNDKAESLTPEWERL